MLSEKKFITTWYWILAFLLALLVVALLPSSQKVLLDLDAYYARYFNNLMGKSKHFDLMVGRLNYQKGDVFVAIMFILFFLVHGFMGKNKTEIKNRLAFWGWAGVLFLILYQGQRIVEGVFNRDSPSKVFDDWINIKELYGIKAKVSNSHCYPSGHAMAYYFTAFLALRRYSRAGWTLLLIALTVPTTRIMTGAHWPSDIFLGSLPISLLIAAVCYETGIRQTYGWSEKVVDVVWALPPLLKMERFNLRLRAAWATLVNQDNQQSKEDNQPKG